tara:strand:- start:4581 stop:5633 length:1053 start_codon:yes stop_codon:yes gene_type:complete
MHFISPTPKNPLEISLWLFLLTLMILLIIVIGGLTRLTDSGLSMVDWRPIMGTIPPLNDLAWIETFNKYQLTPEFNIVNKSMTLNEFKYIFWWEWFHRFFARCIGIVLIIPFLYFFLKNKISKKLFFTLIIVFLLGSLQAFVGWWMVKSGLSENPYVSAYRLTFHLINALVIYCILFWTTLSSFFGKSNNNNNNKYIINFFHLSLFLIFLTIISGGFMAGTHAGNSFNTFPWMNGAFIPDDYYIKEYKFLNIFENTVAINFNHRWLASLTFVFVFSICFYLFISNKFQVNKINLVIVMFFIFLQFLLGVLTLIYNVPINLASMHQTNSTLLLSSILFTYHRYKYLNLKNN